MVAQVLSSCLNSRQFVPVRGAASRIGGVFSMASEHRFAQRIFVRIVHQRHIEDVAASFEVEREGFVSQRGL